MSAVRETLHSFAQAHQDHARHLPALCSAQATLARLCDQLGDHAGWQQPDPAQRTCFQTSLNALRRSSDGMLLCLERQVPVAADTLARTVMELAINQAYALAGGADALQAQLRMHVDRMRTHAQQWLAFARGSDDSQDIANAQQRLARLDELHALYPWYDQAPDWPGIAERSTQAGLGAQYHYVLGTSVSTELALTEDIAYLAWFASLPERDREPARAAWQAEKLSASVFLAAYALWFVCDLVCRLAQVLSEASAMVEAQVAGASLNQVIEEQEQLTAYYRGLPKGSLQG